MKSPYTLLLTAGVFMFFLTSCDKESNALPDKYEFEGEWLWVETTFGWSPPLSPVSLGNSLSLIIDHTTYSLLVNDVVTDQWDYEFKIDTSHFGTPIEYILLETGMRYNVRVDSVNLQLYDQWIDGASWHYIRK